VCEVYVPDGLGSISAVLSIDIAGQYPTYYTNLTQVMDYDAYGRAFQRWTGQGGSDTKHEYVGSLGHTTEKIGPNDPGLIYMQARYYDCELGRFVSSDPSRNGLNWFWYANANPTSMIDPTGHMAQVAIMAIVAAFLIAFGTAFALAFLFDIAYQGLTTGIVDVSRALTHAFAVAFVAGITSALGVVIPLFSAATAVLTSSWCAFLLGVLVLLAALMTADCDTGYRYDVQDWKWQW
jgi:RHS repeat-associated protein